METPTVLLFAHATHWSHLLLYAAPVIAVLIAIGLTAVRGRQAAGDADHPAREQERGEDPGPR